MRERISWFTQPVAGKSSIQRSWLALPSVSLIACFTVACGGAAVPHQELNTAEASIRAAEVGGAPELPQAALHLKYATDGVQQAKALIAKEENEQAQLILQRAAADAEVALAMAQHEEALAEANEVLEQINQLMEKNK